MEEKTEEGQVENKDSGDHHQESPQEKVAQSSPNPDQKLNYICTKCRFNFSMKAETQRAKKCPYCGEGEVMVVKKYKDVDDLIQEAADSKYDY